MNGGAVAYLTHSQYGRNRNEVSINNNDSFITGSSAGRPGDGSTLEDTIYAYNTESGMLASTTGNIYGVYDMNGGAYEYTANWDTLSSDLYEFLSDYGKAVDGEVYFEKGGTSDKYKTAYSNGTDDYYGETVKTVCRTGDGIKETWVSFEHSWFYDYSSFVASSYPFSIRGGGYIDGDDSGVFSALGDCGLADDNYSFRAVLAG